MGALFNAGIPKNPAPAPPPSIGSAVQSQDAERRGRIAALLRRRRGRLGLIATSPRGVAVGARAPGPRRKSLLGE